MVEFDTQGVILAFVGGSIIALAATLNLLFNGRVTGMSGILSTVVMGRRCGLYWKACFICGLLTPGLILVLSVKGWMEDGVTDIGKLKFTLFDTDMYGVTTTELMLGALLVGFGTRLGNGCTSGHGVCGLPRLSIRSIIAVCTFMGVAIAVSTTIRYAGSMEIGFIEDFGEWMDYAPRRRAYITLPVVVVVAIIFMILGRKEIKEILIATLCGFIFAIGLIVSGMTRVQKIKSFLTIDNNWDASLMFVMLSAVTINFVTFKLILSKMEKPVLREDFSGVPKPGKPDVKLVLGAVLFGAGWGICGCCPGPAMIISVLAERGGLLLGMTIVGMYLFEIYAWIETKIKEKTNKGDSSEPQGEEEDDLVDEKSATVAPSPSDETEMNSVDRTGANA